jgi:hypothetical protein
MIFALGGLCLDRVFVFFVQHMWLMCMYVLSRIALSSKCRLCHKIARHEHFVRTYDVEASKSAFQARNIPKAELHKERRGVINKRSLVLPQISAASR